MSKRTFSIRPIRKTDYPQIKEIYEHGLDSGHATYERHALPWEKFVAVKIMSTVYVAVEEDDEEKVLGWVSAAPINSREVFRGVVEDSVYVHPDAQGRGVAGALLDQLIKVCEEQGRWGIHAWIFPENSGSRRLHESRGFQKVGTYSHLAKMPYGELAGHWRDTEVWEKLLPKPDIDV